MGDGKGKTTAALGLALRAVGRGWRVAFFQFLKGGARTGEVIAAARLAPELEIIQCGTGEFILDRPPTAEEIAQAKASVNQAELVLAKAKQEYEKLAAQVKKGYAKVKAKVEEIDVKEMRDDVVDYIRRNPGKSVLIALAVGFVVGYLVRKREP